MRRKKERRRFEDLDDGRPIANMNVEGMPWYAQEDRAADREGPEPPPLGKRETRHFILNALLATLAVAGVFLAAAALLILFCTKVWFR